MYIYMDIQIDWSSDLKLRYLCFMLFCRIFYIYMFVLRYNFCYFGLEMHLLCFNGMKGRIHSMK